MKEKESIIVNATALDSSGALNILFQFVENIPDSGYLWIIFVSDKIMLPPSRRNVDVIPIKGVKSLFKRFIWDAFGVSAWLHKHGIRPIAAVSLQNTGFRTGFNVPCFIYYHQSIPFVPKQWNPLVRNQRTLWFYKNIYPFFVRLFINSYTNVFVQLEYIRLEFHDKFKVPLSNIHVVVPSVSKPDCSEISDIDLPEEQINIFYPATSFFYKNHDIVIKAMSHIVDIKVALYLTVNSDDIHVTGNVDVVYMGRIPYSKVLSMYKSCDGLVFPSYIETYGLPLLEAASMGVPIIASDLPYAREVLAGYDGVTYVPYDDARSWEKAIRSLRKGCRYKPLHIQNSNSWVKMFNIIQTKIFNNV